MANGNGAAGFHPGVNTAGVNLGFTKFLFIVPRRDHCPFVPRIGESVLAGERHHSRCPADHSDGQGDAGSAEDRRQQDQVYP